MATKKLNCWDYKKCGRQLGGDKVAELGVCPAVRDTSLNGENAGSNAGRACWVVAGTFCGGKVQGTFAKKYDTCRSCEFYQLVKNEEGAAFVLSSALLAKQRGGT